MKTYKEIYLSLYKKNGYHDAADAFSNLLTIIEKAKKERSKELVTFDQTDKGWYLSHQTIAYNFYVDLFSKDLKGLATNVDYLEELGVNMVHLMPILQGRPGENDGGYAVMDYRAIEPELGTLADFTTLTSLLRKKQMHVVLDFVINHTAKEHEWAKKALAGDSFYQDYYLMFDDESLPNEFDKTVPEVFPGVAPGNFTYYPEIKKYVWTSFYEFQWDLNFRNPHVFNEIVDILLFMANLGVDMIRLDAIPFMWKELGHTCRNHPTIHQLLEMLQQIMNEVAPGVALLGEAIVEPEEIVRYFGETSQECDVMYNATFMVNLWNALATKDARLLRIDQSRLTPGLQGAWINYARCHDDIGWGFNEQAIQDMGFGPFDHKQFLIQFYLGEHPYSFSKGKLYEFNPVTLDARNSGRLASLVGLEKALEQKDRYQKEVAMKRIHLLHAVLLSSKGIPFIYSGDEIATLNDESYLQDKKKEHDSRWLHRSYFDWNAAKQRTNTLTPEGDVFTTLQRMIQTRKNLSILHSLVKEHYVDTLNTHIYMTHRVLEKESFVGLFNFSDCPQTIHLRPLLPPQALGEYRDLFQGTTVHTDQAITMGPYEYYWLKTV
jgi:amylosucrase